MAFPPDSLYISLFEVYCSQFHIPAAVRPQLQAQILNEIHVTQQTIHQTKFPPDALFLGIFEVYCNQFHIPAENRPQLQAQMLTEIYATQQMSQKSYTSSSNVKSSEKPPTREEIAKEAEQIAAQKSSLSKLLWQWAEASFQLKHGRLPSSSEIVALIGDLSKEKNIDKINWYLAEIRLKLRKSN